MVSTTTTSPGPRKPMLTISSNPSRFHVVKSVRRMLRTIRTECRLFLAKPLRRRPWTLPLVSLVALLILLFILASFAASLLPSHLFTDAKNDGTAFIRSVNAFFPRSVPLATVTSRPCSWLYMEFGAKDGRHIESFFTHPYGFLNEFLRATQSTPRAFCAVAFDPNPAMAKPLLNVRSSHARKACYLNVFTQIVPGATNGTEDVLLRPAKNGNPASKLRVQRLSLSELVLGMTFDWNSSGKEVPHMNTAIGNGNLGAVVLRFNILDVREAYSHLHSLQAVSAEGVLCRRVDRLVLNFEKISVKPSTNTEKEWEDSDVERNWDILMPHTGASNGILGVINVARLVNEMAGCRTTVHVIDERGRMIMPEMVSEQGVMYAVLAGKPTFNERVSAQTETWMSSVPKNRVTIFTNEARREKDLKAARGRTVAVIQPKQPELEKRLPMMQSWSHLVRVRESWDRVMKNDSSIKWLALVDDDTFVFPDGLREYLSVFDSRVKVWGGSGEQARIDNGDGGLFANWLRDIHEKHGGKHCYLQHEDIPARLVGTHVEYGVSKVLNGRRVARKVSHMCTDTFCKMGCPSVPQGAAIVMSRALVEALRENIEKCERDTVHLCHNCGSQRLYMCVNRYVGAARTILTRGICRGPWKLEHRESFPFAMTFHGFTRYHGMALSTKSIAGDMQQLWGLGKKVREEVKLGRRNSFLVGMSRVADLIACDGQGRYTKGKCIGSDGSMREANDGSPTKKKEKHRGA